MTTPQAEARRAAIACLFEPRSIAVVGTSPAGGRGAGVHRNLLATGYAGRLYAVNPKYDEVLGTPCFPSLTALPEPVDCAIIALPAEPATRVVEEAADLGVGSAVLFASGFAEVGAEGAARQARLDAAARGAGMAVCGPNCFGLIALAAGTVAFSGGVPPTLLPGDVAIVSQSGGLSIEVGAALMERGVGLSHLVSCGNEAGTNLEEYLDYLVEQPGLRLLAIVVESFRQPDLLADVARRAAASRIPIVMLKLGRSAAGARVAALHTGADAQAGPDAAALRELGLTLVATPDEFIETLVLFAHAPWPQHDRMAFVSGSGGRAGLMADLADAAGLRLAQFGDATAAELRALLPAFGSVHNPLDLTGAMYDQEGLYAAALAAVLRDPAVGLLAVYQSASAGGGGEDGRANRTVLLAETVATAARAAGKPVVAHTTRAGVADPAVLDTLAAGNVPLLLGAEMTARALAHALEYAAFLRKR